MVAIPRWMVVVAFLVVLLAGCERFASPPSRPARSAIADLIGRYSVVSLGSGVGALKLDTATGETWFYSAIIGHWQPIPTVAQPLRQ